MFRDIKDFVGGCHSCIGKRGHIKNPLAPLQESPIPSRPLERVAVDCVGPLCTSTLGNKYIVVLTDYFTRNAEAYCTKDIQTPTIITVLEKFISSHGVPENLVSDQGSDFLADAIVEVYKRLGINKTKTSRYHPQANGVCEKFNGTLVTALSHLVNEVQEDWCRHVPFALLAYRT
ncbi:hypothetical protein RF55_24313, partial [Lasius niger]